MKKLWTKDFITLLAVSSLVFMASNMTNSPLPRYAMHIGGTSSAAGLVTGLFALSSCVCRPIFGRLLDTRGRRLILLLGVSLYGLLTLFYNWAGTVSVLLLIRFAQGAGMSAYSTALGTVASDLLPPERMVEGFGYYSLVQTAAGSIGPMVGLGLIAGSDYHLLFTLTAAFSAAGLLAASFMRYESKKPARSAQKTFPGTGARPKAKLIERTALPATVTVFFLSITTGVVMTFLSPYAATRGIESIGVYFTVNAVTVFLARLILSALIKRMGVSGVVSMGLAMVGASMVLLFFSDALYLFLFSAVVNGVGIGVLFPIFNSLVVTLCPPEQKGAANGTYYIGIDVGIGAGAVAGGAVVQAAGYPILYLISAVCVAAAYVVYLAAVRVQLRQEPSPAVIPANEM